MCVQSDAAGICLPHTYKHINSVRKPLEMEYELTLAKGHIPIKTPSHFPSATAQEEKTG